MRTEGEAKPPRRPRVISVRLVVVSLVVGVVLAVVSVVVSDAMLGPVPATLRDWTSVGRYEEGGRTAYAFRSGSGPGVRWWLWGAADDGELEPIVPALRAITTEVHKDPRPRSARWLLEDGEREVNLVQAGWPLRCASRGEMWVAGVGTTERWGKLDARLFGRELSLSTRPIWPGLLGNTLFYALLVLTPFALLRWRRLRRRARRGLCVACGYELGEGIGACPECGLARAGA